MASLYDASIPVITKVAQTVLAILKKGTEYAKQNNISEETIINARIYEDMLPLSRQVFIIAATAAKAIERLTGTAPPPLPNKGESLEDLFALMNNALKELASVSKESVQATDGTEIPCQFGPRSFKANALEYVQGYTIPNLYFHLNMTYALLRKLGVPLGKADYLTEFMQNFTEV
jgi:uncharacterized protein